MNMVTCTTFLRCTNGDESMVALARVAVKDDLADVSGCGGGELSR